MKVSANGKQYDLLDTHYKAEGGQAKIYVRDGMAFKIFHDPTKMIPAAKIRELAQLKRANILAPQHVIVNGKGQEVGFTMPSAANFEYLCKLFSKGFRNRNNLSPADIATLVKEMQATLQYIHALKFLVVDYNEMNFLVDDKTFHMPIYIDVDSYQTPSFPATALMESVRDRQIKQNKFTELSDWFSFAVVAFKLYIGAHPYGGIHPNFGGEGVLNARMDAGISVFDKDVQLPSSCQDFSVVPKAHMEWFKKIFINGERSIPPMPDGLAPLAAAVAKIIAGNERFTAVEEAAFVSDILGIDTIAGSRYYLTDDGVYQEKTKVLSFSTRGKKRGIIPVTSTSSFAIAEQNKITGNVVFCDVKKNLIGEIGGDDFTVANGCVYTITNGNLVESSFISFGVKPIHQSQVVGTVFTPTAKLYQGVAMQDMLGRAYCVIPFQRGAAAAIPLPELNGLRVVDAKYEKTFLVVIAETGGKYNRYIFKFDTQTLKYTARIETDIDLDVVSFTVLSNGLCIMAINDRRIEAFFDNAKVKTVDKPPFDSEDTLYSEGSSAMVIKGSKLYKISLK